MTLKRTGPGEKVRSNLSFVSLRYSLISALCLLVGTYLGLKTRISHFTADLHQREQERTVTNEKLNRTKRIPHKPFYAIDVVLDDLDLRATSVVFSEVSCSLVIFLSFRAGF
jgi:hypothetical protein